MVLMCAACVNKVDPTKVVAKVGNKVYSVEDIDQRIENLDAQVQQFFKDKEQKNIIALDKLLKPHNIKREWIFLEEKRAKLTGV